MPIPVPTTAHNEAIAGDELHNISLNHQWRAIVGGQMSRLLHRQFWDGTEAEIDTTLQNLHELIHDLYTTEGSPLPILQFSDFGSLRQTTNQTLFAANSPNAIVWDTGTFDIDHHSRIPLGQDAYYFVSGNFWASCVNAIGWSWVLRLNGVTELAKDFNDAPQLNFIPSLHWQFAAQAEDYIELLIVHAQNATLRVDLLPASLWIASLRYES